jgi:hypothetical protein
MDKGQFNQLTINKGQRTIEEEEWKIDFCHISIFMFDSFKGWDYFWYDFLENLEADRYFIFIGYISQ